MSLVTIDLLPYLEQGNIGSSGNSDNPSRIRTNDYIFCVLPSTAKLSITSSTGKQLQTDFLGYKDNSTVTPICDLYWYSNETIFNLSSYSNIMYFRAVFRYSDASNITPEEITSCYIEIEENPIWHIGLDGLITNDKFPDKAPNVIESPYPKSLWRVENDILTHELFVPKEDLGAFANSNNLRNIYVPNSCKTINREAFRNTKLTSVKLPDDCTYYSTSFPENCNIIGGKLIK